MASISFVRGKWRALIRRKGHPDRSKSFPSHAEAEAWARATESSVDRGERPAAAGGKGPAIDELVRAYRTARAAADRPITRTSNEHYQLIRLEQHFAGVRLATLNTQTLVAFAQRRRRAGVTAYTALLDVTKLGTVLRYACSLGGLQYQEQVRAAMPTLRHLKLVGPGRERDRRPTADEWKRLLAYFKTMPTGLPMADIVQFAAITAMRQSEICRITWQDWDPKRKLQWIRDRKDPREKAGNDQQIPILFGADKIINRQPKIEARIFPYVPGTVSDRWTEACSALGIEDLVFHDLRHEAITRMFEAGMDIPQVAAVSGHRDWKHLRRYTQLRPEGLHQRVRTFSARRVENAKK